jgi:RNA polymerase sigma factor (sigma-70 family)
MVATAPFELLRLLRAEDGTKKEAAWDELIAHHSRLLIAVARTLSTDPDDVMDRYTYILGKLREGDFRRLRSFESDRGAAFSTGLAATARNLCLDHHRSRFGRQRSPRSDGPSALLAAARRALNDPQYSSSDVDPDAMHDDSMSPETGLTLHYRDTCLRDEVDRLSAREKLLLTLRFRDDMSASRIARIVGLPTPFHVYRSLNAILQQLRAGLERRGISDAEG